MKKLLGIVLFVMFFALGILCDGSDKLLGSDVGSDKHIGLSLLCFLGAMFCLINSKKND
jgi:hypothetical protein